MKDNSSFDEIFESTMREDPGFALPNDFAKGVNARIARQLAAKLQMKLMARYALFIAFFVGLVLLSNYTITNSYPEYESYVVSTYWVVLIAIITLFLFFMDKVVLSYLEAKKFNS